MCMRANYGYFTLAHILIHMYKYAKVEREAAYANFTARSTCVKKKEEGINGVFGEAGINGVFGYIRQVRY